MRREPLPPGVHAALGRARQAIEGGDGEAARSAWSEAEHLAGWEGVPVRERLGRASRAEDALSWSLWSAEAGNVSAMYSAACFYRDGVGTRRDGVQAVRWYLAMFAAGDGDGAHEAIAAVKRGMSDAEIRQAGRLLGQEALAMSLIRSVPAEQRRRTGWIRGRGAA